MLAQRLLHKNVFNKIKNSCDFYAARYICTMQTIEIKRTETRNIVNLIRLYGRKKELRFKLKKYWAEYNRIKIAKAQRTSI